MTDRELMEKIYDKVCNVETEVGTVKSDVNTLKSEVSTLKSDVSTLKSDVSTLKSEMKEVKSDICVLKSDVSSLKDRVTSLEMTLENETNRNIRVIAEGHMDLVRKLDEALAVKSEREMMKLRMNVLENDMRVVKNKIGIA